MTRTTGRTTPRAPSRWDCWWAMTAAEPFRLLMPLGTFAAVLGGLVWPLSIWGLWWAPVAPVEVHWRLMLEGFVGFFAIGFLGTAGPRLLSVPPFGRIEANLVFMLSAACLVSTLAGAVALADLSFLLLLLTFFAFFLVRWPLREDWPPPGLLLVLLGSLGTIAATALIMLGHWAPLPVSLMAFARAWIAELWPLLLILGVGPYFFPRYTGAGSRHDFPESRVRPRSWKKRALESGVLGALAIVGLGLEYFFSLNALGIGLRLLAVALFVVRDFPVTRWLRVRGGSGIGVVLGLSGIIASLAFRFLWPESGIAGAHFLYLGGFTMILFSVATRVLLGHSGQGSQLRDFAPASMLLIGGLVVAASLRLIVLWAPAATMWAYHGGGFALALAVTAWALRFVPAVLRPDVE